MVAFGLLLVTVPVFTYFSIVLPSMDVGVPLPLRLLQCVVTLWLATNIVLSYVLAAFVDPGQPPTAAEDADTAKCCPKCQRVKPDRCHHCAICNRLQDEAEAEEVADAKIASATWPADTAQWMRLRAQEAGAFFTEGLASLSNLVLVEVFPRMIERWKKTQKTIDATAVELLGPESLPAVFLLKCVATALLVYVIGGRLARTNESMNAEALFAQIRRLDAVSKGTNEMLREHKETMVRVSDALKRLEARLESTDTEALRRVEAKLEAVHQNQTQPVLQKAQYHQRPAGGAGKTDEAGPGSRPLVRTDSGRSRVHPQEIERQQQQQRPKAPLQEGPVANVPDEELARRPPVAPEGSLRRREPTIAQRPTEGAMRRPVAKRPAESQQPVQAVPQQAAAAQPPPPTQAPHATQESASNPPQLPQPSQGAQQMAPQKPPMQSSGPQPGKGSQTSQQPALQQQSGVQQHQSQQPPMPQPNYLVPKHAVDEAKKQDSPPGTSNPSPPVVPPLAVQPESMWSPNANTASVSPLVFPQPVPHSEQPPVFSSPQKTVFQKRMEERRRQGEIAAAARPAPTDPVAKKDPFAMA